MPTTVNCIVFKTLSPDLSKVVRVPCFEAVSATGVSEPRFPLFARQPASRRRRRRRRLSLSALKHSRSLARSLCPIDRTDRHAEREKKRGEQSLPASLPPSVALLAAEPRAALRVHIRAEAGRRGTTDGHRLQIVGEERGGASAVAVRPSVLSDSARASERSVWSGVTAAYYVCLVGSGALQQSSPPSPLHFNAAFKFLVGAHSERQ